MAARSVLASGQYNRTATGGRTNVAFPGRPGDFNMPEYPANSRPHLPNSTLPEELQKAGYHTQVIGKWHIHSWPHEIGFDNYLIPRVHHAHSAQIYSRDGGPEFAADGYSLEFETAQVEEFLSQQDADRPFFLYFNISPPHCPVADIPEQYRTMYAPEDVTLRENSDEAAINDLDYWLKVYRWDFRYYSFHLPHTETLPEGYDLRHLAAEYYGAVAWMDDAIGRMLRALDTSGLADNTIVLFLSDHGENLGSHGLVQKGTENDESIRVPFIMAGPGIAADERISDQVASLVDVMPTLLARAALAIPPHVQGVDLASTAKEEAIFETVHGVGLRTIDTTYFVGFDPDKNLEPSPRTIFDNTKDPLQLQNLASKKEFPVLDLMVRDFDMTIPTSTLKDFP